MEKGTLFVVATPIGNLEDITLRALRVLKEADYVLCEDTRVTSKLFAHYDIHTKLKRYDAHSSSSLQSEILSDLRAGKQIALVSDAGTPGISDPGIHIIDQIHELKEEIKVVSVPGASSVTAAFSIAGIAGNQFSFFGFVPQKKGRTTFFEELAASPLPAVFFESTHRILKTLEAVAAVAPDKRLVVAREITKMYEEVVRDTPEAVRAYFMENPERQKGEFVLILY